MYFTRDNFQPSGRPVLIKISTTQKKETKKNSEKKNVPVLVHPLGSNYHHLIGETLFIYHSSPYILLNIRVHYANEHWCVILMYVVPSFPIVFSLFLSIFLSVHLPHLYLPP